MQSGRASNENGVRQSPKRQEHGGRQKKKQIQNDESATANEAFHFAAENEEHIHLDRKPKEHRRRMDQSVGGQLPDFSAFPYERAVKSEVSPDPGVSEKTGHDGGKSVDGDEQHRDMHRMTSHPCHRLVVIGGRDSEHCPIKWGGFSRASPVRFGRTMTPRKFAWRSD